MLLSFITLSVFTSIKMNYVNAIVWSRKFSKIKMATQWTFLNVKTRSVRWWRHGIFLNRAENISYFIRDHITLQTLCWNLWVFLWYRLYYARYFFLQLIATSTWLWSSANQLSVWFRLIVLMTKKNLLSFELIEFILNLVEKTSLKLYD